MYIEHSQIDQRGSSSQAAGRDILTTIFTNNVTLDLTDLFNGLGRTSRPQAVNTRDTSNAHPPYLPTSGPPEGNPLPTHAQPPSGAFTRSTTVQSAPRASATHDINFPCVSMIAALPTGTAGTRVDSTECEKGTCNIGTSRGVPQSSSPSTGQQVFQINTQDGSIEAATLDILIDNLIADSTHFRRAAVYRDTFFTVHHAFTTDDDIFENLARRFYDADTKYESAEHRTHLRVNVIEVMKYWVAICPVDRNVLVKIHQFAATLHSSKRMKELAMELHPITTERLRSPPTFPPSVRQSPENPENVTPKDLAVALKMLEEDNFRRIFPRDYISHIRNQEPNNNVDAALKMNGQIKDWVIHSILHCDQLEARSDLLQFFVLTANESHKLRNFASMAAIVTALQSATITCLRLTYGRLSEESKRKTQKMIDLLDSRYNYDAYKVALKKSNSMPCIPWLCVHIQEMKIALETGTDTVDNHGVSMINFAKWTKFHDCVKDVVHKTTHFIPYRRMKAGVLTRFYDFVKDPFQHTTSDATQYLHKAERVLAYLKQELEGTPISSSQDLEHLSKRLGRKEAGCLPLAGARQAGFNLIIPEFE